MAEIYNDEFIKKRMINLAKALDEIESWAIANDFNHILKLDEVWDAFDKLVKKIYPEDKGR